MADVFEAIVNPEITTQFWFTRSSGRLVAGRPIRWDCGDVCDISIQVTATKGEPNRRIVIDGRDTADPQIVNGYTALWTNGHDVRDGYRVPLLTGDGNEPLSEVRGRFDTRVHADAVPTQNAPGAWREAEYSGR